jgi:hypothetical protein
MLFTNIISIDFSANETTGYYVYDDSKFIWFSDVSIVKLLRLKLPILNNLETATSNNTAVFLQHFSNNTPEKNSYNIFSPREATGGIGYVKLHEILRV